MLCIVLCNVLIIDCEDSLKNLIFCNLTHLIVAGVSNNSMKIIFILTCILFSMIRNGVSDLNGDIDIKENNLVKNVVLWSDEYFVKFWIKISSINKSVKKSNLLHVESDGNLIFSLDINRRYILRLKFGSGKSRKVGRIKKGRFYFIKIGQKEVAGKVC